MKSSQIFDPPPIGLISEDSSNGSAQRLEDALKKKRQKLANTKLGIPPETDREV